MYISTEADNFIVIFPDTIEAVMAAVEMADAIEAYKKDLEGTERDHFKIKLNGVGLHCGKGVLVDMQDKLAGETFTIAYGIGEDLCDGANVLVS